MEIYSLTVPEASRNQDVSRVTLLLRPLGDNLLLVWLLLVARDILGGRIAPVSAPVFMWPPPRNVSISFPLLFIVKTLVIGVRAHLGICDNI